MADPNTPRDTIDVDNAELAHELHHLLDGAKLLVGFWITDVKECDTCKDGEEACPVCVMTARHVGGMVALFGKRLGDPETVAQGLGKAKKS